MEILRVYRFIVMVFAIGLVSGCNQSIASPFTRNTPQNSTEIAAQIDRKFSIRYNQIVRLKSEDLEIKFTNVVSDSRCPSETQCVLPGQVEVQFHIVQGDRDLGNINLVNQIGRENASTAIVDGYSIQLLEVKPYPQNSQSIELSDYTAIVKVSRSK